MSGFSLDGISTGRRSRKTSELVARDLATYIVDKKLPEGTKLPSETEMLQALGVGRTTLREALRLLETRGVITIRAGRHGGPVVRRPRPDDLAEALTLILQFEKASLSDVLLSRIVIEPAVAALAATNATPAHIETLQGSIDEMLRHADDQETFLQQNQIFHATVAQASGNTILQIFVESLKSIADGAALSNVQYSPKRRQAVAEAHRKIVDAIAAGDADAASDAMGDHLTAAGRYWKSTYGQAFSSVVKWEA